MGKTNVFKFSRLSELKRRRHRAILNKFLFSFFGLLAIFILSAYLSHLNSLNISEIEISGNKTIDTEAVKETVQEQISGKYLWLFPKTNILYYSKSNIKNKLLDEFKRIKSVDLSILLRRQVKIIFSKYFWQNERRRIYGAEKRQFRTLDVRKPDVQRPKPVILWTRTVMFLTKRHISPGSYFKFYGSADLGSYFSKQNFKQLISFRDILLGIGLKPIALYVTNDGDVQVFLSGGASLATDPKIMFKADADFQNIAENLEAALTTEPLSQNSKINTLRYNILICDLTTRFITNFYEKLLAKFKKTCPQCFRHSWCRRAFFLLAPMSDVTDIAFRFILAKYGKDRENKDRVVFWTEFVAADGYATNWPRKS